MTFSSFALIGPSALREEALRRLQKKPQYQGELPPSDLERFDLIIDLDLDLHPERMARYAQHLSLVLLGSSVRRSLADLSAPVKGKGCRMLGLNALPGFLDRGVWECSYIGETEKNLIAELSAWLGVSLEPLPDQVGMVAPRVLFLIINEAFLLMQEGTASAEDIDTAMKLGTNYPEGPIAWSRKIGLHEVVNLLDLLFEATGEARFKPVAALKRAAATS